MSAFERNLRLLVARGRVDCLSRQTAEEFRALMIARGWNPDILILTPTNNGCAVEVNPLTGSGR